MDYSFYINTLVVRLINVILRECRKLTTDLRTKPIDALHSSFLNGMAIMAKGFGEQAYLHRNGGGCLAVGGYRGAHNSIGVQRHDPEAVRAAARQGVQHCTVSATSAMKIT